jgi:DNA replication and repair protein RecF
LSHLQAESFRCIDAAELAFNPALNVFAGDNGAGKTSFLEAIYLLGNGRSFRTADCRVMIKSGAREGHVTGLATGDAGRQRLGVRIGSDGLEIRIGGQPAGSAADLAITLPVQAIHSDIGNLVQGPPENRRRLLDWGVFHVKHDYLGNWRRFRRTLSQRNAALRSGATDEALTVWDRELAAAASIVDRQRREYLEEIRNEFERVAGDLLGNEVGLQYQSGWAAGEDLEDVLEIGREGDRSMGYTRSGPHRADLSIQVADLASRWRTSRGQQKLLGAAVVLAQCRTVATALGRPVALLVDEPAADLDATKLRALIQAVLAVPAQVFMAALSLEGLPVTGGMMFHVEHGTAKALL